jgi:hypothetical protein
MFLFAASGNSRQPQTTRSSTKQPQASPRNATQGPVRQAQASGCRDQPQIAPYITTDALRSILSFSYALPGRPSLSPARACDVPGRSSPFFFRCTQRVGQARRRPRIRRRPQAPCRLRARRRPQAQRRPHAAAGAASAAGAATAPGAFLSGCCFCSGLLRGYTYQGRGLFLLRVATRLHI